VQDKPKITGLSFNLFAVITLLVILPLAVATVSSLATANVQDYESVNELVDRNDPAMCYGGLGTTSLMNWVDKGQNATKAYMDNNPTSVVTDYETMYDEDGSYYGSYMAEGCIPNSDRFRNGERFFVAHDNHYSLRLFEPNHAGYIGYSGTSFSFQVTHHYFKWLDNSQDISKFKFTFIDFDNTFNCELENFYQDVSYSSDITFIYDNIGSSQKTFANFEFNQNNKYEVDWIPLNTVPAYSNGTGQPYGSICHIKMVLEFELNPFEVMEFSELYGKNYENLSAIINVYDIEAVYNSSTLQQGFTTQMPVPLQGNWKAGVLFEVAYADTTRTNFFLNGGTLLMGGGLFALAIANTPYWNPVVNFFKSEGE